MSCRLSQDVAIRVDYDYLVDEMMAKMLEAAQPVYLQSDRADAGIKISATRSREITAAVDADVTPHLT